MNKIPSPKQQRRPLPSLQCGKKLVLDALPVWRWSTFPYRLVALETYPCAVGGSFRHDQGISVLPNTHRINAERKRRMSSFSLGPENSPKLLYFTLKLRGRGLWAQYEGLPTVGHLQNCKTHIFVPQSSLSCIISV